jgi:predicted dehydrogenase
MHKVLIIGLGKIGLGYDLEYDDDCYALTHARAFNNHKLFELVGGVDLNLKQRDLFTKKYACEAFTNLSEAIEKTNPSIIVISTPTENHFSTINNVLKETTPVAILCEKPIAYNYEHAKEIVTKCKKLNCALYVNYMRLSDVGVAEIHKRITNMRIHGPFKGVVWYSKGLFNSASHFVNLLELLLGEVISIQLINKGRLFEDVDPEPDFNIKFEQGCIQFNALKAENFFHNSMELNAENGRLRYERGGENIYWDGIDTNNIFSGYTTLSLETETLKSDFLRMQWHVADQLARSINKQSSNICTGENALRTLKTLEKVKELL